MAKTSLKVKLPVSQSSRCAVTHVVSVAAVRMLFIKSLEFVASASVKWRIVANFQVSQRLPGKASW